MLAAGLPSPGLYIALGLGIGACGSGWVQFARRDQPGASRLAGAAAVTVGAIACMLAIVRVVLVTVAIHHIEGMLPGQQ